MRGRFAIGLCLLLCAGWLSAERCYQYRLEVRREHARTLGLNYPWWYALGQLRQESQCRSDLTAFDGGMGLAQFMPATAAEVSRRAGIPLDPYRPADAIRLQAIFIADLHRQNPVNRLWATYQAYNGGWTLLKREAVRAGRWDHDVMREACHRKVLPLKGGKVLDFCTVNYSYSRQVAKYGDPYREGPDRMPFW